MAHPVFCWCVVRLVCVDRSVCSAYHLSWAASFAGGQSGFVRFSVRTTTCVMALIVQCTSQPVVQHDKCGPTVYGGCVRGGSVHTHVILLWWSSVWHRSRPDGRVYAHVCALSCGHQQVAAASSCLHVHAQHVFSVMPDVPQSYPPMMPAHAVAESSNTQSCARSSGSRPVE